MKYSKSIYSLLIFFIALMTYQQHLGLNALLIPILLSVVHYFHNKDTLDKRWFLAAALWTLSGLGIFLWHLDIGIPLFLICGFHFFAISYHPQISLPNSLLQSIISFFTGVGRFFMIDLKPIERSSFSDNTKKILRVFLMISIPLLIFIVFLRLYQSANTEFAELTKFINLDFLEAPFFFYFAILAVFSYGFFYFKPSNLILQIDLEKEDDVNYENHEKEENKSQSKFEWQTGLIVVLSLCLLLIAFIAIDFNTVFGAAKPGLNHSKSVHQSINILIASIVMVIIIILYLFRGGLNFNPSNLLKATTYFWLGLNCIVVLLILAKNSQYIDAWGLTHKRIGVYIYSMLCIVGIGFTVFKLYKKKTTSFLIKTTSTTFLTTLVLYGLFNWNGLIVSYNLNEKNLASEKVDLYYLTKLGPEVYPKLTSYLKNNIRHNESLLYSLESKIESLQMSYSTDWTDFFSYTFSGYKANNLLKDHQTEKFGHPYFYF